VQIEAYEALQEGDLHFASQSLTPPTLLVDLRRFFQICFLGNFVKIDHAALRDKAF
jgi:hypothetical protein